MWIIIGGLCLVIAGLVAALRDVKKVTFAEDMAKVSRFKQYEIEKIVERAGPDAERAFLVRVINLAQKERSTLLEAYEKLR